jgi:hypothetical protein
VASSSLVALPAHAVADNRSGPGSIGTGAWGALVPVVVVPWLLREQRREFDRLLVQAREHPGWWNRRLGSQETRV